MKRVSHGLFDTNQITAHRLHHLIMRIITLICSKEIKREKPENNHYFQALAVIECDAF